MVQESSCGCAGIYSAPAALPLYAEAFEAAGALHRLEGFASHNGPDFYRMPRNAGTVTLRCGTSRCVDVVAVIMLPFLRLQPPTLGMLLRLNLVSVAWWVTLGSPVPLCFPNPLFSGHLISATLTLPRLYAALAPKAIRRVVLWVVPQSAVDVRSG